MSSEVDQALALIEVYAPISADIEAALAAAVNDPDPASKRRKLRALAARVDAMTLRADGQAQTWAATALSAVYAAGAQATEETTGGSYEGDSGLSALRDAALLALLAATLSARKRARALARADADHVDALLLGTMHEVTSPHLRAELARPAIGVRYKNGARVSLATYTEMVIRTQTQAAYNTGVVEAPKAAGVTRVKLTDGPKCGLTSHDDPRKANGRVVALATALAHPLAHPNCSRAVAPVGASLRAANATTGIDPRLSRGAQRRIAQAGARSARRASRAAKLSRA